MSQVKFIEVRGRSIAYREMGNASGSTLVFVHAFASNSTTWIPTATHLAKAGFRIIAFDLPGHGRSDWLGSYSLASMEEALASAVDQLGLRRFDLIGHSLGGHLALRLGARFPDRVSRVVVEASPVPPKDESDAEAMMRTGTKPSLWRSIKLLGFGRLIRIALLRQFDFKASKPVLGELRKPMPDWWLGLKKIRSQCLVLTSKNDGMVTSRADLLVAVLRYANSQIIGEGHHLHTRHGAAFINAVMPFLLAPEGDRFSSP